MADYIDEYVEILKSQGKTDLEISNILLESNEAQIEAELKKEKDPAVTTAPVGSTDLLSSTDLSSEDSSLEQPLVDEVSLTVETKPEPPFDEVEVEVLKEVKIPIKFEGFDNEDEGTAVLNKAYNEYGFTTSVDFAPGTDQVTVTSADNKSIQLIGKSSFNKKQELLDRQGKETQTYEDYLEEFNNFIIDNQSVDEETKNFTKLTGANINNVNLANPNVFVDDIYNIVDDVVTDPRKYGVDLGTFANRAITDYDFGRKKPEIIDATKEELIRRYPEADSNGINDLIAQTLGKNDVIFSNVFSNKRQQESLQTKQDLEENIFSQESIDKYKEHAGLGGPFKEAVEALKTGNMTAAREAFSKARFQTKQTGRSKYSKRTEYQPDTFWSTEDFENKSIFPGNESVEVKKAKYDASRAYFQDIIKRTSPPKEHPAVSLDRTLNNLVKENFVRYNEGNNKTLVVNFEKEPSGRLKKALYRDGLINKEDKTIELSYNQIAKYEEQGNFYAPNVLSQEDRDTAFLDYKAYREYGIQLKNDLNAVSDLLYNNMDPASLKASGAAAKVGLFAESAVDATIDMMYGSQTLNDWDNDRAIAERYKEAQRIHNAADPKNPISFTKEQTNAMGMTMADNVVSGVGAFVPMAFELAGVHAIMGPVAGVVAGEATGLARVLNAGSKIQKGAAHVVKFAFEEAAMQTAGFRAGSGGTFYAVGQGISGWNPFKKRFGYLRPFFDKVVKSGVSGSVSLEAAGVVETFIEDLGGHADFNKFLDENYGDYTEVGKRVLTNYLTFSAFGLKSLNTKDFKSNAEIRKTATEAFEKGDIETGLKLISFANYRGVNEQFNLNTNEGRQFATDHISNLYKEMGYEGPVNIEYNVSADIMGKGNDAEFSMIKGTPTIKVKEGIEWANANLRHEMTHGMFEVAFKGNKAAKEAFFNTVDKAVKELVVDPEFKKITGVDLEAHLKEKYDFKKGTTKYNEEAVTSIIELLSRPEVLESAYSPTILKSLKNDVVEVGKKLNIGQTKLETGQDLINFLGRFVKSDIFGEGTKEMRQLIELQINNAPTPQQVEATKAYNVKFNSKEFADISKKNYEIISALQGKGEATGKKSLPQMIVESDKAGKDAMVKRMLEDYGGTIEQAYKEFEAGTGGLDPITKARYENEFFELNGALITNELKYFDESKGGTREDYSAETKNNLLDLARTYKTNPFYILENGETVDTTKYNKKKMSEFLEKNPTAFNDLSTPNPVDFGGYAVRMLGLRRPAIFEKFKTVKQQEDFYNVSLDTAENAEQILQGAVNTGYSGTTEGATRTLKDINKKQIDLVNKLDLNNEGFEDKVRSVDINDYTFNQKNVITVDDIIKSTGVAVVKPNGKISPKATNEALVKWFGLDGKPNVDAEARLKAFYNTMPQQYYTRSENITETSAATGIPKWIVSNLMVETGERLNVKTAQQKGGEGTYAAGKIRELVSYPEFKEILTKTFDGAAPQKLNTVMQNLLKVISGNVTNTELRKLNKDVINANEVALLRDGTNDLLASKKFKDLSKDTAAHLRKLTELGSDYDQNRQVILNLLYELENARQENTQTPQFDKLTKISKEEAENFKNKEVVIESYKDLMGSVMNVIGKKAPLFTTDDINTIAAFDNANRAGLAVNAREARDNALPLKLSDLSNQAWKSVNSAEAKYIELIKNIQGVEKLKTPKTGKFLPTSTKEFKRALINKRTKLPQNTKKEVYKSIEKVLKGTETNKDLELLKAHREYGRALDFAIQSTVYDSYNEIKKTNPKKAEQGLYYFHKDAQGASNTSLRGFSGFRYIQKGASIEEMYLEHLKPRLFASAAGYSSMKEGVFNKQTFNKSREGFEGAFGKEYNFSTVMDGLHSRVSNQEIFRFLGNEKLAKNTIDLLTGKTVWQTMQEAGATKYVKQYKKYQDLLRKTAKDMGVEVKDKNDYEVWEGVKEASLEAKVKASKKFKEEKPRTVKEFNGIIKRATGQDMRVKIDEATARIEGAGKKGTWFVPYSNEDFAGLMYPLYGKGKQGNADMAFIKENLLDKFNEGEFAIATERAMISDKMNKINANFKNLNVGFHKMLRKPIEEGSAFNNQHAVRTWIWNQMGVENIPGLKFASEKKLLSVIENNAKLKEYAATILESNGGDYPSPEKYWESGSIAGDFLKAFQGTKRKEHLGEWMQNIDAFFTPETMNRLQAKFGTNYVDALKGSIKAMKRGTNRTPSGDNKFDKYLDYVNNSVGAVMFLNTKSAVLQSLSAVNYINFTDNNPVAIGRVMSNPKEFTKTFNELWNSDYLVGRRDGLKINVSEAEVAQMLEGGTGSWFNTVTGKAIKLGFTPTRLMDSFAIAFGGTTFFINRQKTYLKQGMTPEKAKEAATKDWIALSEEAQQSSRTDRISADQRGNLGRLVLAFANTPIQYNRLMKKALLDLKDGRGNKMTNISKSLYYGALQNIIFSTLQQGLFSVMFNGDDSSDTEVVDVSEGENPVQSSAFKAASGTMDTFLRGLGPRGAVIYTLKNMALKTYTESLKDRPEYDKAAYEVFSISPPIKSKVTKLRQGYDVFTYDIKSWEDFTAPIESFSDPRIFAALKFTSAFTNVGVDRASVFNSQIQNAMNDELSNIQRIGSILGWQSYELGIEQDKKLDLRKPKKGLYDFDLDLNLNMRLEKLKLK